MGSKENSDETMDKTKSLEKRNSMKRRNSKKKKDSEPEKKFKDDIDQALHEIQLMEKESQSKSNTNSLKSKRPSKKYKKAPSNDKETTPEAEPQNEGKKVAVQFRVRVADMKEPSDDEDEDEEIQCLVEEPVKKAQNVIEHRPTSNQDKKESETTDKVFEDKDGMTPKASGFSLPITEMTDDWMDDGQALGSMDSEDEEEAHPYKPTPSPYKEEAPVKRSPDPVCGFALTSNTPTSSAYKKDEEDEEKPVEEPPKPQQASGIALPITEMTDDWMDDGQALGSMDSEEEEDANKSEEKSV